MRLFSCRCVKWHEDFIIYLFFCAASLRLLSPSHSSSVTEETSTSPQYTFRPPSFRPSFLPVTLPLLPPSARRSSEGHELKLPLGLPLRHPHRVGGVLRHLHDADGERLISLVDMVSHYLAGGEGRQQGELAPAYTARRPQKPAAPTAAGVKGTRQ